MQLLMQLVACNQLHAIVSMQLPITRNLLVACNQGSLVEAETADKLVCVEF